MIKEFTKEFILERTGCQTKEQVEENLTSEIYNLIEVLPVTHPHFTIVDKFWIVCMRLSTKEENLEITEGVKAIAIANGFYSTEMANFYNFGTAQGVNERITAAGLIQLVMSACKEENSQYHPLLLQFLIDYVNSK
jgi:hypothetical protein